MEALDVPAFNAGLAACGLLVSAVLALYPLFYVRNGSRDERFQRMLKRDRHARRSYLGICLFSMLLTASDLLSWVLPLPLNDTQAFTVLLSNFGFNASAALLLVCFNGYLRGMLETRRAPDGSAPRFPCSRIALVLTVTYLLGCALSIDTRWFFTVSLTTRFHRGDWFWLAQAIMVALYVITFATIVANRRLVARRELAALTGYVALPAAAELVQVLNFGFALVDVAVPLAIALLFVGVQETREAELQASDLEVAEAQLERMEERLSPQELYARVDELRHLCRTDPDAAARAVGEFSHWLREHTAAFRQE